MIVVRIELHSAITGDTIDLGSIIIDNLTGGGPRADYRCRAYQKGKFEKYGRRTPIHCKPIREAQILNHARLKEPVQNLVAKSLKVLGYET